jgi:hypothetical protein
MKRRRRNPVDVNSFLTLGMLAGGAYVFISYILPMLQKLAIPGNTITTSIANLFPGTSPSVSIQSQLTVVMPDGTSFPAANLTGLNFQTVNGQAQFTFNGATYALTPQVNGVYQAIAL